MFNKHKIIIDSENLFNNSLKSVKSKSRQNKNLYLLDKFYTKTSCAKHIIDITLKFFPNIKVFVEPSAGSGNISNLLKNFGLDVLSYDLVPEAVDIIQADYLKTNISLQNHITIGNPPFGYKGNLAIQFLNKALLESYAVAFIMPITAKKYSLQKHILLSAILIYEEILPNNSFEFPNKTDYSCPSVFQIWSLNSNFKNLRLSKPVTNHPDFYLYRHNATKQSQHYINYDWDFAIYAQGHKDYKKFFFPSDKELIKNQLLNTNNQFYFIKAKNKKILQNLQSIDFDKLAHTNHITPGFCKNDIIQEYNSIFDTQGNKKCPM